MYLTITIREEEEARNHDEISRVTLSVIIGVTIEVLFEDSICESVEGSR